MAAIVRFLLPLLALSLAISLAPAGALAQTDRVRLSEVLPALAGTDLGAIDVGAAPPPGSTRTVFRSEVLAALARAGRDARGLAIPQRTRIERRARELDASALAALARPAVERAMAPCTVEAIDVRAGARVAEGELEIVAEGAPPARTASAPVVLSLRAAGAEVRIPASARVACPPPIVQPGASLRLFVRSGAVVASAPGVARQAGRAGDVIAAVNAITRAAVRARVVDAHSAEVVP